MSKQFINEVSRMKDLFGYKKGQVISEQDFKPFNPNGSYPSLGIGGQNNLTQKQKEASAAGWGPVTDEYAKTLKVGPDGKILPKQGGTPADPFMAFPCLKSLKTEKKATATATGVPMKIGEGGLKQYMFGSDGTLYSYGQEYGKWSCGTKPNTILINGKEVSNLPTTQTSPNVTVYTIPSALKDAEGVKKFQDWLDSTIDGWLGKPGVKLNKNKGKGYGNFGSKTKAAWDKYKNRYNSGGNLKYNARPGVTDADAPVDDTQTKNYASIPPANDSDVPDLMFNDNAPKRKF